MDKIRLKILEKIYKAKKGHIGTCFSCVEIVLAIKEIIKHGDKFILSKGHGSVVMEVIDVPGYVWELHNFQSLGNGVGIGIGIALANPKNMVYCAVGDGEIEEGSFQESLMYLKANDIGNIRVVVDCNGFKGLSKSIVSGEYDGHNIETIKSKLKNEVISYAKTIKGKGIDFLENTLESHYKRLNEEEYKECVKILSVN